MKDGLLTVGITLGLFTLVAGLIFGIISLRQYMESEWNKKADEQCKVIASLADSKEYKVDSEYSCMLVIDGKIVQVKDW